MTTCYDPNLEVQNDRHGYSALACVASPHYTGCKLKFLAVKYPFSILVKMEHIHLNLGSNKKPNRYSEFFMRFSVLERIALLFEYFYTKYPFMPYSNSFSSY